MLLEQRGLIRPATVAGTKAGGLGINSSVAKADMLTLGAPGGTRRTAIDAGRLDASIKDPIEGGIADDEGGPTRVVVDPRDVVPVWNGGHVAHGLVLKQPVLISVDIKPPPRSCTPILAVKPDLNHSATEPTAPSRDASCPPRRADARPGRASRSQSGNRGRHRRRRARRGCVRTDCGRGVLR
jgi:hypothetical protein